MAAEMVIWDNLERALRIPAVAGLPVALKKERDSLLDIVRGAQEAVAGLEGRDQIRDELSDHLRRGRLESLSTLLYQADDLVAKILGIDQRARHQRNHQREKWNPLVRQVVHAVARSTPEVGLFGSSKLMVGRVRKITKDLETVVRQLSNQFDSSNHPEQRQFQHNESFKPIQHRLIGRKDDKKNIMNMLLQTPRGGKSNVSVICMSGLPGVGKSALAKDMYEDDKVKSHFDLRMWIPVTDITDETEIIRQIVESFTDNKSSYYNSLVHQKDEGSFRDFLGCRSSGVSTGALNNSGQQSEIEIYERRLRNEIKGKHYLIVLDDVCLQKWQSLRGLLAGGARGSKILMTTSRDAEITGLEAQSYTLHGLNGRKSWKLFRTLALDQDQSHDAEMEIIGFKIADICKSVPLTIKVAARFIHGKTRDELFAFIRWLKSIKDQDIDVMEHVLYLSYSDLPTRLRACFGYCSLFPYDFTFNKRDLINLWIAQGFVNPEDGRSLQDQGEKYFMELSRRFLLEEVSTDELGNILTCKMHPIICNLASKSAAGIAKLQLTDSCMIYIPEPASKHVSVNCRGGSPMKLSSQLLNDSSLRTLVFLNEPDCDTKLDKWVCNQLISRYRRLRVLDLHDLGIKELPDSIGGQIYLKYLDLSKNDGLVTLPKSFTKLYNLQTLKLNSCLKLKHLDINFGLLVNLICFEVDGCLSLTSMPVGLGKLTQLETLNRFVVGSSNQTASVQLKALRELTMLRGRLAIELTGDWMTSIPEAKQALITKEYLEELKISWPHQTLSNIQVPLQKEIIAHGEILENLKPNKNLKILHIEGYKGDYFPSWANEDMKRSLPNLVIICIQGCGKCRFLPSFGELAHLRKLTLRHMAHLQFIEDVSSLEPAVGGSQLLVQDPPFFQSLQELTLHNFFDLEGWRQEVATVEQAKPRSFPCLSKLMIWNCPKLTSFPSFAEVFDINLQNVNHLLLEECAKKARVLKSKFGTRSLQIKSCLDLEGFRPIREGLGGLPHLKYLAIESCDAIVSLTPEIGKISSLERLEISSCKELDLSEDSIAPVSVLGQVAFIVSSILPSPWINLKSLHDLKLREIPKMKALPDGLKHVKTLKSLSLTACQSLGSLPEWISNLTSLQHLQIEDCPALKTLPDGLKDIRSLMKVEITECPELMNRCQEHNGEDWPKIKHARVLLHKSRRYEYV